MNNNLKTPWCSTIEEIRQALETNLLKGLSNADAQNRLNIYGLNELPETKKINPLKIFINQFTNILVLLLVSALAIAVLLGEFADAIAIACILVINAIIGFAQEYRSEKSLAALRKLTKPKSRVIRNGTEIIVQSHDLVPGDLVILNEGDIVPADARIIYATFLLAQEASLTGESIPVEKNATALSSTKLSIGERKNMVYMGTSIVRGKGTILITQTGLKTELGKIALMLQIPEEKTPLQKQLELVGKQLIVICSLIVIAIFILGFLRGSSFFTMLLIALSLSVAAIPEGLPAIVTIALAIGVQKMSKKKALIRRLASVETLGCTSVICTDKTGTLTKNEMTVVKLLVNDEIFDVAGDGYGINGEFTHQQVAILPEQYQDLMQLLTISVLCNGASLQKINDIWHVMGDPTEGALLVAAAKAGLEKSRLEADFKIITEIPFDSNRKRMSMVRNTPDGSTLFIKGAPEIIVSLSTKILRAGKIIEITELHKKQIQTTLNTFGSQALRVLALAYRPITIEEAPHNTIEIEQDLIFVGLVAMIDPPRPEVRAAIQTCKNGGIRTVMITGDHKETAIAIGKQLQLIDDRSSALTGYDLDAMNDHELKKVILNISIYAQTTAEHKVRIVQALKMQGEIVAVTGDGVNDAPAIKTADIGIAMGITGSEVSKEAADMIITDDNFASIVQAVEEGRGIYDNIVKCINYLLSSNIAELLIIFSGALFNFRDPAGSPYIPLLPIQLLWLNIVTDGLPALALVIDPVDKQIMQRVPRNKSTQILTTSFLLQICIVGLIITCGALFGCFYGLKTSSTLANTITLTLLVLLEFVRITVIRSRYNIGFFSNKWLIAALTSSLLLQIFLIYTPLGQNVFKLTPLRLIDWFIIITITLAIWVVTFVVEKLFIRKTDFEKV